MAIRSIQTPYLVIAYEERGFPDDVRTNAIQERAKE